MAPTHEKTTSSEQFRSETRSVKDRVADEIAALPPELRQLLRDLQRLERMGYLDSRALLRHLPLED